MLKQTKLWNSISYNLFNIVKEITNVKEKPSDTVNLRLSNNAMANKD